jgi:hypothetical protein
MEVIHETQDYEDEKSFCSISSIDSLRDPNREPTPEPIEENPIPEFSAVAKIETCPSPEEAAAAEGFKVIFNTKAAAAAAATATEPAETSAATANKITTKYRGKLQDPTDTNIIVETNISKIDDFLEKEITNTRNENWNKLDKGSKIQKLHIFAETYIKENKLPTKEVRQLKNFFSDCINKNKLQKAKDVNYDKATGAILSIPSLTINSISRNFTLKNLDTKRVSTLKSLTPKRTTVNAPVTA